MVNSILDDTKKVLNLAADYDVFDPDIVMHINTVFFTLSQLGIGPDVGFSITDSSTTWDAFIGTTDKRLNAVKTYIYLRVRLLFDPPQTSYLIDALNKQVEELEWRLNVMREQTAWVAPNPPVIDADDDDSVILDAGPA
jgi:hypothetical protein